MKHIRFDIPVITPDSPVLLIGAGGIVESAHLPAYQLAGIPVAGIFDINRTRAEAVASRFQIPQVYGNLDDMLRECPANCIFDIAVPGNMVANIIAHLPDNSFALLQKPMGETLRQAEEILTLCRNKRITAGVNFQLRYAPYISMARQMLQEGLLGDICDVEVYVNVYTPWHQWDFLKGAERVEILYHSIHYIDLMRSLLGEPQRIFAQSTRHPKMQHLQDVKSNIVMDYGTFNRVHISTNHVHAFGPDKQDAFIKIEGTKGAVKIKPGLLLNYPHGAADVFEYCILNNESNEWKHLPINGSWFPHAFIGSMHELIRARQGLIGQPDNSVEDAIHTMRLVEQAYKG